jgi:methyltransferase (TIGR00027 family)
MVKIGQLRYIQTKFESGEYRNPDNLSQALLSKGQLLGAIVRGLFRIGRLRRIPFYYYVVARTKYYDDVFSAAIAQGFDAIVNIGCGSDTRAHRFAAALETAGCAVVECDQAGAIEAKCRMAARKWPANTIIYQAIDLNDSTWPALERTLRCRGWNKVLVMMEGVSPYINLDSFVAFLGFLANTLPVESRIAYDFKLFGSADDFGKSDRTARPFRLSCDITSVTDFHRRVGLVVDYLAHGPEVSLQYLPALQSMGTPLFVADALVQTHIPRQRGPETLP